MLQHPQHLLGCLDKCQFTTQTGFVDYQTKRTIIIMLLSGLSSFEDCPCLSINTCEWTPNMFSLMKELDKTDASRIGAIDFMKSLICDTATKRIKCCKINSQISLPRQVQVFKDTTKEEYEKSEAETK